MEAERKIIIIPDELFEDWEVALREYLKRRFPDDDRQFPDVDEETIMNRRENFIFRGIIFGKSKGEY
jgi:hypothetical protein